MGIISPTLPTVGGDNATEDVDVLNTLQALVDLVNGSIDDANLDEANITSFLKLLVPGDREVAFGNATSAVWPGATALHTASVSHGMGGTPTIVLAFATSITGTGPVVVTGNGKNATTLFFQLQTANGSLPSSAQTTTFDWIAIR